MNILSMTEIVEALRTLLTRYNAEYAIVFGSYARGDATPNSDLDVVIVGGNNFIPRNIFALSEDLRELIGRNADVFEISEVNAGTPFYESIMREGVWIS